METYKEMSERHQEEVNAFPIGAAFSNEQFAEMMKKWGYRVSQKNMIVSLGYGCFIRRSDLHAYTEMMMRHKRERNEAIKADVTGEGFIYQMFADEMADHEYGYTGDLEEVLEAVGMTLEEIANNPALSAGLIKAKRRYGYA